MKTKLKELGQLKDLEGKTIKFVDGGYTGQTDFTIITDDKEILCYDLSVDKYWDQATIIPKDSSDFLEKLMYSEEDQETLVELNIFTQEEMNKMILIHKKAKVRRRRRKQKHQDKLDLYYKLKEELGL